MKGKQGRRTRKNFKGAEHILPFQRDRTLPPESQSEAAHAPYITPFWAVERKDREPRVPSGHRHSSRKEVTCRRSQPQLPGVGGGAVWGRPATRASKHSDTKRGPSTPARGNSHAPHCSDPFSGETFGTECGNSTPTRMGIQPLNYPPSSSSTFTSSPLQWAHFTQSRNTLNTEDDSGSCLLLHQSEECTAT